MAKLTCPFLIVVLVLYRGCAFLTYADPASAELAICALHERMSLHHRPMVVRYAGAINTPQCDSKLFVGMLARTSDESLVRQLFAPFDEIKEVFVMRDLITGQSKGCAFVKLASREGAIRAIEAMHEQYQDQGQQNN
jgi:CUG-BP- and ETR3-like factor